MSESKWRKMVAAEIEGHMSERDFEQGCAFICGYDGDDRAGHIAGALSPVLAQMKREWQAEALREAADEVQAVYDMQCPPMPVDRYIDRGAHAAHQWWTTVLGSTLRDLRDRAEASGQEGER